MNAHEPLPPDLTALEARLAARNVEPPARLQARVARVVDEELRRQRVRSRWEFAEFYLAAAMVLATLAYIVTNGEARAMEIVPRAESPSAAAFAPWRAFLQSAVPPSDPITGD